MERREKGLLTKQDLAALDLGDDNYFNNLGADYYSKGEYDKARIFYEIAGILGNDVSPTNLGYIYMYGRDVPADYSVALAFYKIGAKQGNLDALYKLGNIYQNGQGVEKDNSIALYYYRKVLERIDDDEVSAFDYPSVFLALAKEMISGKIFLKKAYYYLITAVKGYTHLIDDDNASYYKDTLKTTKDLLKDPIFDGYRNKYNEGDYVELIPVGHTGKVVHLTESDEEWYYLVDFSDGAEEPIVCPEQDLKSTR